jgi:hypothetical protein
MRSSTPYIQQQIQRRRKKMARMQASLDSLAAQSAEALSDTGELLLWICSRGY